MKILGYEINDAGCDSTTCFVRHNQLDGIDKPCTCVPRVDVATRKKILTRLNIYRSSEDDSLPVPHAVEQIAWTSTCPICGNSVWHVPNVGRVCDTPKCKYSTL